MKKIMFYASLVLSVQGNALAEKSELFPFPDITVGMQAKELIDRYPSEEILAPKKNDEQALEEGVVMYPVQTNDFWDSLGVQIEGAKVKSLTYCKVNRELLLAKNFDALDFSNVVENVRPLFQQLKQQLGTAFEKKVTYRFTREGNTRCAMYIWKRENDVVAFSHSPVSQYKKGDLFECQLTVVPTYEYLGVIRQLATDSVPEDAALWADATGEEKTGGWLFLVIGVSAVIGAILAWRCFRKRNK